VFDAPGVSIERQLSFFEDTLRPGALIIDIIVYFSATLLAIQLASARRRLKRSAPMKPHLSLLLGVISCLSAQAQSALPGDVLRFVERRDLCDHFRGEDPYDAARRKFLEASMRRFCTGTDDQLKALKSKYKTKPEVLLQLNEYESRIETKRN
jgi:hypothetical protein